METQQQERYKEVPCDALIANGSVVRHPNQSYVMFWKGRRNARLALSKRLKGGPSATMLLDTKTMSVLTDRSKGYTFSVNNRDADRRPLKDMVYIKKQQEVTV